MVENGIGVSVLRKEDNRFLIGKGNYTDDINVAGQTHAYFLRSPHGHATIDSIDISAAAASAGVVAVFTGDDLAADGIGPLICGVTVTSDDGEPHRAPAHPALAQGKVNYVGDHVACVLGPYFSVITLLVYGHVACLIGPHFGSSANRLASNLQATPARSS